MTSERTLSPSEPLVETHKLARRFGKLIAVHSVSFSVERGEVFGLLGANGAGKSTLLRMLCGILRPSSGSGKVVGFDIEQEAELIKQHIGYMTQRFGLYHDLSAEENLRFYAGIYGIKRRQRRVLVEQALERGGLVERRNQLAGTFSGGWQQRLALACATIYQPPLLFLDEPTAGVDPVSRRQFWGMIHTLSSSGTTIIVTTHYMDEAARCHRLGFLFSGYLLELGTPEEIVTRRKLQIISIEVDQQAKAIARLRSLSDVDDAAAFGPKIRVATQGGIDARAVVQNLFAKEGIGIISIEDMTPTVEDAFVAIMHRQQELQAKAKAIA